MQKPVVIQASASKSYLQRVLLSSALCKGRSVLCQVSWCDDTLAVRKIVEDFGVQILEKLGDLRIDSSGISLNKKKYHVGESGLAIRMLAPIFALSKDTHVLDGKGSLKFRPMQMIVDALTQLGVKVETNNNFLPIRITGPIKAGVITIDASLSSQLLTGLLMALPLADSNSLIKVKNLKSKPYIDMTLALLSEHGVEIQHENYEVFKIKGNQKYQTIDYKVEGDWSGAAFFLVYGAVHSAVEVKNLLSNSLQADKFIIKALNMAGAHVESQSDSVIVRSSKLNAFEFDATHCPDLFPPLVCLASQCRGTSRIKGVLRLKYKESDRASVLQKEFAKMCIQIDIDNDVMSVIGTKPQPCIIDSHNDHRIAMAGAVMNRFCDGEIMIKNKEAINKSYPNFFEQLRGI